MIVWVLGVEIGCVEFGREGGEFDFITCADDEPRATRGKAAAQCRPDATRCAENSVNGLCT
jgi:hypothetical protein